MTVTANCSHNAHNMYVTPVDGTVVAAAVTLPSCSHTQVTDMLLLPLYVHM